jgi:hypothetical protein
MKIVYIILGVIALLFIIVQIWAVSTRTGIESYPFTVEKKFDNFEIRNYEASLFTSVKINSKDYKEASSKGFSALGGYIFGANETNEKISMTSPVTMSLGDTMEVMFLVTFRLKTSQQNELLQLLLVVGQTQRKLRNTKKS